MNPFTQRWIVPRLVKIGPVVFFLISFKNTYFLYFIINSPWKWTGPFNWRNLYQIHLRMLCAKIGQKWSNGSGEEDFQISSNISAISLLSSLGKGKALHSNNIESPSLKDVLCQVWLKILEKNILKYFSLFCFYLPLETGGDLHLKKLESPSFKNALYQM